MISIYDQFIPTLINSLASLSCILDKAKTFADSKKIDMTVLFQTRLIPDQYPLSRQIQIACDNAKFFIARMTGIEVHKFADTEATFEEFKQRIAQTITLLEKVKPTDFEGYESKTIEFHWNPGMHITADVYLTKYVFPNFYFHMATAYSILRASGVDIGKADFIGALPWIKN